MVIIILLKLENMKLYHAFSLAMVFGIMLAFASCKKDVPTPNSTAFKLKGDLFYENYDDFGAKLENVISHCVQDSRFAQELILQTQKMEDGDFEVLLSKFLNGEIKEKGTIKALLLEKANGLFEESDLDKFVDEYPSVIIAVRGNPIRWSKAEYIPPVKFVPSTFDQKAKSCMATQEGEPVTIDLTQDFVDAVVALHISERHDEQGNLIKSQKVVERVGERSIQPKIKAGDVEGEKGLTGILGGGEPTECPTVLPSLISFTAIPQNGAIKISYQVENLPTSLGNFGRVRIRRLNPDGTYTLFQRFSHSPTVFYDQTGTPGTTYDYSAEAYVAYFDDAYGGWAPICSDGNILWVTETYPGFGASLDSYVGENYDNSHISYSWYPIPGISIDEYRIQRLGSNGYSTIATLDGQQTHYQYTHYQSDRGNKVQTRIQYRSAGSWQGDFVDKSYASYRNPGEPLVLYGLKMGTSTLNGYEAGESPLYGAPELRFFVIEPDGQDQASAEASAGEIPPGASVLTSDFLFMTPCIEKIPSPWFPWDDISVATGYYYPTDFPEGYTLIPDWDNDLYGSAMKIEMFETDFHGAVPTSGTNVETTTKSVSGKFGLKIKLGADNGLDLGGEASSEHKSTKTTEIAYPAADLDMGNLPVIYYHNKPKLKRGRFFFGNETIRNQSKGDPCSSMESIDKKG